VEAEIRDTQKKKASFRSQLGAWFERKSSSRRLGNVPFQPTDASQGTGNRSLGSPLVPKSPPRFLYIRWTLRDGGARLTRFTQIIGFPKDSQISSSNRWWFQLAGNWQPTQPRAALTLCPGTFHADPRPPSKVCRTLRGHSRYSRSPTYRLVSGTVCEEGGKNESYVGFYVGF
jgi:hypothetical protein